MAKLKDGTRIYGNAQVDTTLTTADLVVTGNIVVRGTTTTVDTTSTTIKDPLITLGASEDGTVPNDGHERGLILKYNDGTTKTGFVGWDTSNGQFAMAATTTFDSANNEVTIGTYGNLKASHFIGEGDLLGNITGANVTGTVALANMSAYAGNVVNNAQPNITSVGTLSSLRVGNGTANSYFGNGTITADGLANVGTLNVVSDANIGGNLDVRGNITGNFTGNLGGKGPSNSVQFNDGGWINGDSAFTFDKTTGALNVTGTVTGGNLNTAGTVTATGAANVGSLNVTGAANVTGNLSAGNISTAGAAAVTGNISGGNITTTGLVSATGNVTGGNLITAGEANVGTLTASGNISGANVSTTGIVSATGTVTGGNLSTGGALNVTGTGTIGNIISGGYANITGNVTGGNLNTAGIVSATGNVTGGNLVTTGTADIANLKISGYVDGSLTPSTATGGNLGVTGNAWNNLTMAGNINIGSQTISANSAGITLSNTVTATNVTATANVSAGNVTASGTVTGANVQSNALTATRVTFAGTNGVLTDDSALTFASSTLSAPNVTASGTVTGANVQSNALTQDRVTFAGTNGVLTDDSAFTVDTVSGKLTATLLGGTLTTNAQPNITSVGTLTDLTVTNVANANINGYASTVYTNAQPNITSVGTLTSVTVSGNATVQGNLVTDSIHANGTGSITITAGATNGSVVLAPQGTGTVDVSGVVISNIATPTQADHAATKGYVDSVAQGLDVKDSVRAATTTNITLSGTQTIDGVVLTAGQRVLVKNQTIGSENGIYVVASGAWARSSDAVDGKITAGSFAFVEEGTVNHDSGWVVNTDGVITVGTTSIGFTKFSAAGDYTAGDGLTLTGTEFSARVDNSTIDIKAGEIHVKDGLTLVTPNIGAATGQSLNIAGGNLTADVVKANAVTIQNNGNITGANVISGNLLTGTLTTAAQPNVTSVGTLTSLTVSGEASFGDGNVVANSGGIYTDGYYYANGQQIDFQTAAGNAFEIQFHADGLNDLAASSDFAYNPTTGLLVNNAANVSGTLSAGNIVDNSLTAGRITFAGASKELKDSANLTYDGTTLATGNANVTSTLAAGNIVDNSLTTGRITFAGASKELTDSSSLTYDGTTFTTPNANIGNITTTKIVDTSLTATQVLFATTGGEIVGDADLTYDLSTNLLSGKSADFVTGVTAGNVTANNLTSGRVVLSGTAGKLTDASSLTYDTATTTLTTTGNISANYLNGNYVTGNGSALSSLTGGNVVGQVGNALIAGTVYTNAQPNITSVGTLTSLAVSGVSNLGPVGNLTLTGGNAGEYLKTNGSGGLSFAPIDLTKIENGTSNVSIPVADGNVVISVGGVANVLTVTGVGANITGTLDVTGNVNANNINAANLIVASGNIDATSTVTGTVTVTGGIGATGNIMTGHSVGFANNNGGTTSKAYIQFNATANSLDFIFN